jgi:uncharacterized protein YegL
MTASVHVLFVIDSSGSMTSKAADVRGGFNEYVASLGDDTATAYLLTAVTFDTTVTTLFTAAPLYQVPILDQSNYRPGGNTALYDALGVSLAELTSAMRTEAAPLGADRALIIVMTDGEENSSRRYTKEQVVRMIADREAAGNWTFVYLGADQDAWVAASGLGFKPGNVAAFAKAATSDMFGKLAYGTKAYSASAMPQSEDFIQQMEADPDADKQP